MNDFDREWDEDTEPVVARAEDDPYEDYRRTEMAALVAMDREQRSNE